MMHTIRYIFLSLFIPLLWFSEAEAECTAYFSWEPLPGSNTGIQFENESSGDFNTWHWNFGDGTTSAVFSPEHIFSEFGEYLVCLTVSDGAGCTDVYCDTVVVSPECTADFEFTLVPTTPIYIQFTDLSTGFPDTWLWTFGDGQTSAEQNPVHPYPVAGTYEVCLVIEHNDSGYYCIDSICKTVIIPDSLNCEADYTYHQSNTNPLEISFFDQSVGDITSWEWDFGDGTISHEENPVHIFPEPAKYMVCLEVSNQDTAQHCFHFLCKNIDLSDTVFCHSDFSAMADSSSNEMYRFFFTDESLGYPDSWLWDFGDGNTSHERNPSHTYAEPGTYEVCLNTWNSNYPNCNDTYCKLVKSSSYYHIGGMAYLGEDPMNNPYHQGDTGMAILYRQQGNHNLVAVDTTLFHHLGYYWFTNMMEMKYVVRISLSPASTHYHDFVPSYYSEAMTWQEAEVFMLSHEMYEMNTSMLSTEGAENGPGRISGRLMAGDSRTEAHRAFHELPVILADAAGNTPLEWTSTNEFGEFEFNSLALGTYTLFADAAGIWSESETVMLDENNLLIDTVIIEMFQAAPLAIDEPEPLQIELSSLYPNPVSDQLHLELQALSRQSADILILNLTGQAVYQYNAGIQEGKNTLSLNSAGLPAGLYLLMIRWDGQNQAISKRFIKN